MKLVKQTGLYNLAALAFTACVYVFFSAFPGIGSSTRSPGPVYLEHEGNCSLTYWGSLPSDDSTPDSLSLRDEKKASQ